MITRKTARGGGSIGKKETESGKQTKRRKSKGEEREWEDGERERETEERID